MLTPLETLIRHISIFPIKSVEVYKNLIEFGKSY